MSRWLKLLLTWMLALALPLQALAAGAMVHCGGHAGAGHHAPPGHGHGEAAAQPGHGAAGHGARAAVHQACAVTGGMAGGMPGEVAVEPAQTVDLQALHPHAIPAGSTAAGAPAGAAAADGAAAPADPAWAQSSAPHHSSLGLHGKCSACAACCGLVALPSAAPALGSVAVDTAYAVASLPAPAGHVPAGDERPPRSL